jgi:predicted metal-dependent hydrolase
VQVRIPLTDHLTEPNHTPVYWNLVKRVAPGFENQKTNLAAVGKGVWLGDTS